MAAIFINTLTAGTTIGWVHSDGATRMFGIVRGIGVTHHEESYTLPPATPFVEVESGDDSYVLGPVCRWKITASQITWTGLDR